jgi:hypothetical protein
LFYTSPDGRLNAIDVSDTGSKIEKTSPPKPLFDVRGDFAVSLDGSRFLTVVPVGDEATRPITVVLNRGFGPKK